MNLILSKLLIAAGIALGVSLPVSSARILPVERLGCLFQIAHTVKEVRGISFSFAPSADRLRPSASSRRTAEPEIAEMPSQPPSETVEFKANFNRLRKPASIDDETTESWPLYRALRRWQSNPRLSGLSQRLWEPRSVLALDYSDIFETGRAPYKGGHGVSLFWRRTF